ncbi:SDR family oxidoreductase [Acidobacteriota bacterium]
MNILVTGATGYIGRRLTQRLLADPGVKLRLFVRNSKKIQVDGDPRLEIREGNTFDKDSLRKALEGIDTAFYLIHSMGSRGDYARLDRLSAENFRDACIASNVQRIIYLGGLGSEETASRHLQSRIETGKILSAKPESIQTIWIRAGIIIGSGSASFEMIRNLVQKLPVMITPKWVKTKTQPIGINDVLEYLFQAKNLGSKENCVIDVGADVMSFKDMLLKAAEVMELKRWIVTVPFLTPRLSSYWLLFITPVSFRIAKNLIEGLKSKTVVLNDNAKNYFAAINPMAFERSFGLALFDIINNQVLSSWCDSSAGAVCDIKHQDRIASAVLTEKKIFELTNVIPEKAFQALLTIGGEKGWFRYNWMWRMRGLLDKISGGPGLSRGRRDASSLRLGDSLDFWKVADLEPNKRLLLISQMKLPGKGWFEFSVAENRLEITAYFLPKGVLGRIYWYTLKPFHALIYANLGKSILKTARNL